MNYFYFLVYLFIYFFPKSSGLKTEPEILGTRALYDFVRETGTKLTEPCKSVLYKLANPVEDELGFDSIFFISLHNALNKLITTNSSDFDDYDECLAAKFNGELGQYCILQDTNNLNSFGFCLPSSCPSKDLEPILSGWLNQKGLQTQIRHDCDTLQNNSFQLSNVGIFDAISFFHSVGAFILVLLLVPILSMLNVSFPKSLQFLVFFDGVKSWKNLFLKTSYPRNRRIAFVHGFRAILVIIIIAFNYCAFSDVLISQQQGGFSNPKTHNSLASFIMKFGSLSLTIVYLISGLATTYLWLGELEQCKGKVTFARYLLFRRWRISPIMVGTILMASLWRFFGDGPLMKEQFNLVGSNCAKFGIVTWLYSTNLLPASYACLPQTWLLGADFHLTLISFPILIGLYKSPSKSFKNLLLRILIGFFGPPLIIAYTPFISITSWQLYGYRYLAILNYIGIHSLGMAIGYLIANGKGISQSNTTFWIMGWIIFPLLSYKAYTWSNYDLLTSMDFSTNLTASINRLLFSSGFAWTSYACAFGMGGSINKLLSSKYLVPISRMAVSIFVAHILVVYLNISVQRDITTDPFTLARKIMSTIVMSIFVGFLVFIVQESPNYILAREKLVPKPQSDESNQTKVD